MSPAALTVTYQAPVSVLTGNVTLTATFGRRHHQGCQCHFHRWCPVRDRIARWQLCLPGVWPGQTGPFNVAGVFTLASGQITGGEQDFTDARFVLVADPINSTSTITATPDGNLQIILDTSDSKIGVGGNGIETLNLAVTSISSGTTYNRWAGELVRYLRHGKRATQPSECSILESRLQAVGLPLSLPAVAINGCAGAIGGVINIDSARGHLGCRQRHRHKLLRYG